MVRYISNDATEDIAMVSIMGGFVKIFKNTDHKNECRLVPDPD